jgi:hypothetical protein
MDRGPEAISKKTLAGFAVLAALVTALATPIAAWVGPGGQGLVVRIAVSCFAAVIAHRLLSVIKAGALVGNQTPAEIALQPRATEVEVDALMLQLVKETRPGLRQVSSALWQRVQSLCCRRGVAVPDEPALRPSRKDIARIIRHLEDST